MRRLRGMTLFEVLTSMAIMGVLGVILLRIYDVSRTAYASGTGQIALQQKARTLTERITPLLVSALPPNEVEPAVASPPPDGTISSTIIFHVPTQPFHARTPTYRRVRIFHGPDKAVYLDPDTPTNLLDDQALARDVRKMEFSLMAQNVVKLAIEVYGTSRAATNRDKVQLYQLETLVQIPFYSTR